MKWKTALLVPASCRYHRLTSRLLHACDARIDWELLGG
jgi:hypothetical protein